MSFGSLLKVSCFFAVDSFCLGVNFALIEVFNLQDSNRLRRNNFDLMRLLLAGVVLLVHSFELSGYRQLQFFADFLSSAIAVKAFFVVSGFLIFMSYERSSSIGEYFKKRFLRIYPAYFLVVIFCSVGLFSLSNEGLLSYFGSDWLQYLACNLTFLGFLHSWLPGVFELNKVSAVNGALWTIKIEVMFYFLVPLVGCLFKIYSRIVILVFIYLLSFIYSVYFDWLADITGFGFYSELSRQLPGQLMYFMAGAFFYYYLSFFERFVGFFVGFALVVFFVGLFCGVLTFFEPIAIAVLVCFFGLYCYAGNFGKYGDFSYGVYIIHFPVIQVVLSLGDFVDSPWLFLLLVVFLVGLGAVLLWNIVEKRFLYYRVHRA